MFFWVGAISGNITQEISTNVGLGTIAGATLICVGIASVPVPVPGARVPAGVAACVILLIDIIN